MLAPERQVNKDASQGLCERPCERLDLSVYDSS